MKKIKRYVIDDFTSEVYACSLVDAPAIESGFVSFAAQMPKVVMLESDEKRMVAGPVLIPDKEIYRYDEYTGEEFYLVFTAKAIERLAGKYLRDWNTTNWTVDHERYANGVYTMESWIKSDMEKDKSVVLGLDPGLPVGTWFMTARIDSDEIWTEVKGGRWSGFSVEAWISVTEENLRKQTNNEEKMNENNFIERLKALFNEFFGQDAPAEAVEEPRQEELEQQPEAEEVTKNEPEAESAPEEPVELAEEPSVEEEPADEEPEEDRVAELEARVAELEKELADVLDRLAQANLKVQEMSKQPSAKPVNVKASTEGKADVMDTIRALREGTYFKN